MPLNEQSVTLAAAAIAALFSVVNAVINLAESRASELRLARRQSLEPRVVELGKTLHEIVAMTKIGAARTREGQKGDKWLSQAHDAAERLKKLRVDTRYSLWGVDRGLRTLALLPSWVEHKRQMPDVEQLLSQADRLRSALDEAIRRSYENGRTPNWWERARRVLCRWRMETMEGDKCWRG